MRAYQTTGDVATCAGSAPASGASGWFRYATANHSSGGEFNRFHAMDVQRFALVPLPAAQGGPAAGAPTFWDTDWGTCLNDNEWMDCEAARPRAARRSPWRPARRRSPRRARPTRRSSPSRRRRGRQLADGRYAGRRRSPTRTARCMSRAPATAASTARPSTSPAPRATATSPCNQSATQLSTCLLPKTLPAALTGPGGTDPFRGASALTCASLLSDTGHCWATMPTTTTPLAPHPAAKTNATGTPTPTATTTVAKGAAVEHSGADAAAGRQAVAAPEADEDRGDVVRPHRAGPPVRLDRLGGQGDVRPDGRRERRVRGELEGRPQRHVLGHRARVVHLDRDPCVVGVGHGHQAVGQVGHHALRRRRRGRGVGRSFAPLVAPLAPRCGVRSSSSREGQAVAGVLAAAHSPRSGVSRSPVLGSWPPPVVTFPSHIDVFDHSR